MVDWDGAKTLLEILKNYKLEKRKTFILKIINQALKDVFQEDYRIDILPKDMKGKSIASTQKYDIIFFHNNIEIAKNAELLISNGGGVLSIASLFFKVLIGYLYSKNKFFIFDESLSQVSPQYRERLSLFLREFCATYDFTLVVVSQTEELERHANLVYEVEAAVDEERVPLLKIKNVIGEIPTQGYFYTEVKNFQSIKNLSFIYKGFTIIRGPNNSGKSASLRAIDSLLFNNFKPDVYQRKNPSGGRLETKVTFGFKGKPEDDKKEIALTYKRDKVMFTIEGEEYFGKSLAADKLKEAVEDIGFKYIEVKNLYKNFKGPLQEQTERIAFTSQHDGLFLIGAKASDSDKIFSFLFNTENIALAIAEAKEGLQSFNREHKESQEELAIIKEELHKTLLQIDYYLKLYYSLLFQEFQDVEHNQIMLATAVEVTKEKFNKIQQFIYAVESSDWLQQTEIALKSDHNKLEHNNRQQSFIQEILLKISLWNDSNKLIELVDSKLQISDKLEKTNQLIPRIQSVVNINDYINTNDKLQRLTGDISNVNQNRINLDEEYHLEVCTNCSGAGVCVH